MGALFLMYRGYFVWAIGWRKMKIIYHMKIIYPLDKSFRIHYYIENNLYAQTR